MDKYTTLQEYINAEIDVIEDDEEFVQAEHDEIQRWFFERGFSADDRQFAINRGYEESLAYWEE